LKNDFLNEDDSTCDCALIFLEMRTSTIMKKRKSTRCYQNRRKPGWEKLKNSSTLGRTQAAAIFPRADFAIIYFYSHSVSVYFYQQQNENRKM
jgi:hypothetical protein